jgi:3-oxoacyl-[acyl-carrier-protein] synthase-3
MTGRATIIGTGSYLPERILTNKELEKIVKTSDEWITTRTGIKSRRIAGPGEETSVMATQAAIRAMKMAGVTAPELDMIIVGTITAEMVMPSCACLVQKEIGAENAFAFDVSAACSGFVYALEIADRYLKNAPDMKILVLGAETLSARVNWQDRNTCVLFGDGAGACVVTGSVSNAGMLASQLYSDGRLWQLLQQFL